MENIETPEFSNAHWENGTTTGESNEYGTFATTPAKLFVSW
jgi:hypothetical protein